MVDSPPGALNEQPSPGRRLNPRAARLVGVAVVAAAVVILVVQNSQRVSLRFLFVTGHVPLIWVMVVCLAVAGAFGFLVGRRGRVRRRRLRRRSSSE
jgi:uncharacterized integral membrane protein